MESIKNLDLQAGNTISFLKANPRGSQTVYPTFIQAGVFQPVQDWRTLRAP